MSRDLAFVVVNVIVFVVAYYFGRMLEKADNVRDRRAQDYEQRSIGRVQAMEAMKLSQAADDPALFSAEMDRIRREELEDVG